ncbi:MAG: hypothetical protein A2138_06105 [Deltaproteobacteria bacterium RBG_16_71_12]|nr:MAG: hypothetical protein A2138_06105 [Deltaproteobacteria bacterium RBG_16_71_12]
MTVQSLFLHTDAISSPSVEHQTLSMRLARCAASMTYSMTGRPAMGATFLLRIDLLPARAVMMATLVMGAPLETAAPSHGRTAPRSERACGVRLCRCNRLSSAAPPCRRPTSLPKNRSQSPEGLIDGRAVRKHVEDGRVNDHDVRTLRIPCRGDPAYGSGEVVLRTHRIAVGCRLFSPIILLHIASVLSDLTMAYQRKSI